MTDEAVEAVNLSDLVAEEIRAMMARKRISGRQLAQKLGVSPSWVSYRLTGVQPIDLNDLQRIAHALDVIVLNLLPRQALQPRTSSTEATTR
ncbi:MAG TPA: helix-turn-helix transcriptional regulator [Micromonospora sp.]